MAHEASTEPPETVEEIARLYLNASAGYASMTLRCAISDALVEDGAFGV